MPQYNFNKLDDNETAWEIPHMKIITGFDLLYSNKSNLKTFPESFSLNFTEYDILFSNNFVKVSNPKAKSSNIFVIDEKTKEPRSYEFSNEEVYIYLPK